MENNYWYKVLLCKSDEYYYCEILKIPVSDSSDSSITVDGERIMKTAQDYAFYPTKKEAMRYCLELLPSTILTLENRKTFLNSSLTLHKKILIEIDKFNGDFLNYQRVFYIKQKSKKIMEKWRNLGSNEITNEIIRLDNTIKLLTKRMNEYLKEMEI